MYVYNVCNVCNLCNLCMYIWYGILCHVISCNVTYCNVMECHVCMYCKVVYVRMYACMYLLYYDIPILGAQISIESMPGAAEFAECVADEI